MIPVFIDEDTKSTAERKLFTMLRDMPNTDDWYVLHSAGIARQPTQAKEKQTMPCWWVYLLQWSRCEKTI